MSSRTRTHCPGCGNPYEPRARKCHLCGRNRDQMSDAEAAAQFAPPQPVAPPPQQNQQRHHQPPAPYHPPQYPVPYAAAPPARQPATSANKKTPIWGYVVGTLLFFFVLGKIATRPPAPDPTPPPAPVAYVPSADEKATAAKQAASDAKFWAEKEKKEAAELKQSQTEKLETSYSGESTGDRSPKRYSDEGYNGEEKNGAPTYLTPAPRQARPGSYPGSDMDQVSQAPSRTGAVCSDGSSSSSTGRGACSRHGGVDHWLYN